VSFELNAPLQNTIFNFRISYHIVTIVLQKNYGNHDLETIFVTVSHDMMSLWLLDECVYAQAILRYAKKKELSSCICRVLRRTSLTRHFRFLLMTLRPSSLTSRQKFSRIDSITTAVLGLKTNMQNYTIVLRSEIWIDYPAFVCTMHLSRSGAVNMEMGFARTVCRSGVRYNMPGSSRFAK
jgi:hypothetical protein